MTSGRIRSFDTVSTLRMRAVGTTTSTCFLCRTHTATHWWVHPSGIPVQVCGDCHVRDDTHGT
jgi:hypothetical protein